MSKRAATTSERRHMGRVASLPCCLCGAHGVQVHHIREGVGMAQRNANWCTVPLCPECHANITVLLNVYKTTEFKLLNQTLDSLYGGMS